jgi:N-acetylmuramoyl-L-alanine amidase
MPSKTITGKMSFFGGPADTGVSPSEGLALCEPSEVSTFPDTMFLPQQPPGTTGLARRLNPDYPYVAARWDYDVTPRDYLQGVVVIVTNTKTGKSLSARPIDWGPNTNTGRAMDLSPGLCKNLGLETDDTARMVIQLPAAAPVTRYGSICISSGHGLHIRGASGSPVPPQLDEVDEARKVVNAVAEELRKRKVEVDVFHDDTSHDQNTNLHTIVNHHNAQERDLDVSVHFNAFDHSAHGTECLYVTQNTLANQISSAIAALGFTNRGGKKRTDLYFLNQTTMPSILIETAFCDNDGDCNLYRAKFDAICKSIATVLSGSTALKQPARHAASKR